MRGKEQLAVRQQVPSAERRDVAAERSYSSAALRSCHKGGSSIGRYCLNKVNLIFFGNITAFCGDFVTLYYNLKFISGFSH